METHYFFASLKDEFNSKKVQLKQHKVKPNYEEYYTYVDKNGVEQKYTNTYISKCDDNYIGLIKKTHNVKLNKVEGVEHIDSKPAYFTYTVNNVEVPYTGDMVYDNLSYSYSFSKDTVRYYDNYITLIKE